MEEQIAPSLISVKKPKKSKPKKKVVKEVEGFRVLVPEEGKYFVVRFD
jgi:hypothetical protein